MEFRFRAGEEREPSFPSASSCGGCLAARAGLFGDIGRMDPGLMHPATPLEALKRELQEEQIRGEIIARKIMHRRMLEEQVRREMEMERAMVIGRFQVEPMVEDMMQFAPVDLAVERFGPSLVPHYREVVFDEGLPLPANPEIQIKLSKSELPGIKRKAVVAPGTSRKFPRPAQTEWSCALCQVSAMNKEGLKDHLQGKKHKAEEAQLSGASKKIALGFKNSGGSTSKPKAAVGGKGKGLLPPAHGSNMVSIQVDGKLHQVVQKRNYLWCWICKVMCNSTAVMVTHICGKKHTSLTGDSKGDDDKKPAEATG